MDRSAYLDALYLLSRRSLTVAECRTRLLDKEHTAVDVDAAIARLLETGGLNDAAVAREYARAASEVKGRGRLRVQRELVARGIDRHLAAEAVGDVFGDKDERALVARAIQKRLRGKARPESAAELAKLYQYLMRQGFTPAVVSAALRKLRGSGSRGRWEDDEVE